MAQQPDNTGEGRRRRVVNRRSGGMAFSGGGLSNSTAGVGNLGAEDNDEDFDLNEAVAERVSAPRRAAAPQPADDPDDTERVTLRPPANQPDNLGEAITPRIRLAQVRARSTDMEREYRLQLIHRMIMRNIPKDQIADQLGISVRQLERDQKELTTRLRQASKDLDIETIIGHSRGFYEEVQAMSLRMASQNETPTPMKLAAMRVALASHNDMHRFYQAAGVYDVLRFRKGAEGGAITDIQRLMDFTDEMLVEARREGRNQDPLGDFSSAEQEIVDL